MRVLLALTICIFLSTCARTQSTKESVDQSDIKSELKMLFPEGTVTVDILGLKENPRLIELHLIMQESLSKNYDWMVEYAKNRPEGETLPYHPNMGLTELQYDSILNMKDDIELIPVNQESIEIIKSRSTIRFKATDQLQVLNYLTINIDKNRVIFNGKELQFDRRFAINDDTNALRSKWSGFGWKRTEPKDLSIDMVVDRENLNAARYSFDVGKLESNNRTFIRLKVIEIVSGQKQMEFEIPLLLRSFD